ncbi:MAG: DUF2911 domain-containing protein [Gemmatimonadota bacterium]
MLRLAAVATAAALFQGCSVNSPAEHFGFVARLGHDTVSVESVTRRGNTLVSDEVDRFPRVRRRHTEIRLGDGGTIRHLIMDITTPSEPENQRERRVVADVTSDSVHITKTDRSGTRNMAFATRGGVAMAHVPQMYSLYDLYFAAALHRADAAKSPVGKPVEMRQFYIDREFDRFPLHHGSVRPLPGGKAEIQHDWLSGIGEASIDSAHRLTGYSGARTTYKVEVQRLSVVPDVKAIGAAFAAAETQHGVQAQMSLRDTTRATVGNATITVDYGRPMARGRELLGNIIPYDQVWRTGANAATQIDVSAPLTIAGLRLVAGTYTLWTLPHANGAELIVNKQHGQWGTSYDVAFDLGRAPVAVTTAGAPVEKFTISILPGDARHAALALEWGAFKWTAPIVIL